MRIGLVNELHGRPGGDAPPPSWSSVSSRARVAEDVGFDSFVYEDALLYRGDTSADGCWEAVSISGALAATTTRIRIGPSVFNAPYRSPALLARIADTLDEISDGRFVFGLGAGNTADSDYRAFGFPTDLRYSRFEEAIQIIHGLLKFGSVDFEGSYHSARDSELVLRGPRPQGPPIIVAGGGPKMMRLAARYADEWNWWAVDDDDGEFAEFRGKVEAFEQACAAEDRDPESIGRSLDLYSIDVATMDASQVADRIVGLRDLGVGEVRVDLLPQSEAAIEGFASVVEIVQSA